MLGFCFNRQGRGLTSLLAVGLGLLMAGAASAQPVLITSPQTVGPLQTEITPTAGGSPVPLATAEITVRGTTLTINGRHQIASLVVEPNGATAGVVTHSNAFSFDYAGDGSDVVNGLHLIVGGDVFIDANSRIDVTGRGFGAGQGPGAGFSGFCGANRHGGGGGHSSRGGQSCNQPGGLQYGSLDAPTNFGSGGGAGVSGSSAGRGGGALFLMASSIVFNGDVFADGTDGTSSAGGGAGGSIWIRTNDIVSLGSISASGGTSTAAGGAGGGGSGGRVVLDAHNIVLSSSIKVSGGKHAFPIAVAYQGSGGYQAGGPGTVLLISDAGRVVYIDNSHLDNPATAAPHEIIGSTSWVGDCFIIASTVSHSPGSVGAQLNVDGSLTIAANAQLSLDGKGFRGGRGIIESGSGPGGGPSSFCGSNAHGLGGSHGGVGGRSCIAASGRPEYGNNMEPLELGSGGGSGVNRLGGDGGGSLALFVSDQLQVDGRLSANGLGTVSSSGAGAGGSLLVFASSIIGNGTVSANGGMATGNGGGGGGGRIAIYSCHIDPSILLEADGGSTNGPPPGYTGGGTGSIYLQISRVEALNPMQIACIGDIVALFGNLKGGQPLNYMWSYRGKPLSDGPTPWGSVISGSQSDSLSISNIQPQDAGLYTVVASTECGMVESNPVAVDVYCDCEPVVLTGGIDDNFALPRELTSPSSDLERVLLERRPGRPFHEFDQIPVVTPDIESDSRLAHSFTGLPADIVSARLTMRVQAGGSGNNTIIAEGTDSIRLGFTTAQSTAASNDDRIWERRFGDLPGQPTGLFDAGQIWTRGDTRLFTLDLAALPVSARLGEIDPNAVNLIDQLNANGFLDVTVVDETGVDFMRLELETSDGRVVTWVAGPVGEPEVIETLRAELTVVTSTLAGPHTYQWLQGGQPIDAVANPTAASATLVLDPVSRMDAGVYTCIVTGANSCNSAESSGFVLEVIPACRPGDIADDFGLTIDEGGGPDGVVDFGDFAALLGLIGDCPGGAPGCLGDIADDFGLTADKGGGPNGVVDFGDFAALLGLIGPCP